MGVMPYKSLASEEGGKRQGRPRLNKGEQKTMKLYLTKHERLLVSMACKTMGIESFRNKVDFCGKVRFRFNGVCYFPFLSALRDCDFLVSADSEKSVCYGIYKFVFVSPERYYMLNLSNGIKCFEQGNETEDYNFHLVRAPLYKLTIPSDVPRIRHLIHTLWWCGIFFEIPWKPIEKKLSALITKT